jgi:Zn-finger nucleic acid-binding protein
MDLTCPKCHGQMRTYERNGVHVDQCSECRGIFLDRGELERLIDAENRWHEASPAPAGPGQRQQPQQPAAGATGGSQLGAVVGEVLQQARAAKHGRHGQQYGHGYEHRRRKKSFLDELFD